MKNVGLRTNPSPLRGELFGRKPVHGLRSAPPVATIPRPAGAKCGKMKRVSDPVQWEINDESPRGFDAAEQHADLLGGSGPGWFPAPARQMRYQRGTIGYFQPGPH